MTEVDLAGWLGFAAGIVVMIIVCLVIHLI